MLGVSQKLFACSWVLIFNFGYCNVCSESSRSFLWLNAKTENYHAWFLVFFYDLDVKTEDNTIFQLKKKKRGLNLLLLEGLVWMDRKDCIQTLQKSSL